MVQKQPKITFCVAVLVSLAIAIPPGLTAQAQSAGQRAGEVSRIIPVVGIQRASKKLNAAPKTAVLWEDVVTTQAGARARVALDDGSVLNIGSESSVHIIKHDAGAQQTDLELTYGRLRSNATKIAKPKGKFQVRTPAGVAGVVGTDFYILYLNGVMLLIVFDGTVEFCNLMGQCITVTGGQTSKLRAGGNEQPSPAQQATPQMLTEAGESTMVGKSGGEGEVHNHKALKIILIGGALAIPAIVIPLVMSNKTSGTGGNQPCPPNPPKGIICP